jgi:chromosome segregation ATPase
LKKRKPPFLRRLSETPPESGCEEPDASTGVKKKKVNPYKIRKIKDQIEQLEGQIQLHETRIAVLTQLLASEELYRDHQLFRSTMEEHDRLQGELTQLMEQWEMLNSEIQSLQS